MAPDTTGLALHSRPEWPTKAIFFHIVSAYQPLGPFSRTTSRGQITAAVTGAQFCGKVQHVGEKGKAPENTGFTGISRVQDGVQVDKLGLQILCLPAKVYDATSQCSSFLAKP